MFSSLCPTMPCSLTAAGYFRHVRLPTIKLALVEGTYQGNPFWASGRGLSIANALLGCDVSLGAHGIGVQRLMLVCGTDRGSQSLPEVCNLAAGCFSLRRCISCCLLAGWGAFHLLPHHLPTHSPLPVWPLQMLGQLRSAFPVSKLGLQQEIAMVEAAFAVQQVDIRPCANMT